MTVDTRHIKLKLIADYERYIEMYNNTDTTDIPSWKVKYMSIIVYLSDLFSELFNEDIENHTFIKLKEDE